MDEGSFAEVGPIAGTSESENGELNSFTPANYVLGSANLDGRPCAVGGEDFTVRGGSPSVAGLRKSVFAETMALRYRIPLIRLLEGAGGSVTGSSGARRSAGPDGLNVTPRFASIAEVMGSVPVVSAALGPVAGMPAARLLVAYVKLAPRIRNRGFVLLGMGRKMTYHEES